MPNATLRVYDDGTADATDIVNITELLVKNGNKNKEMIQGALERIGVGTITLFKSLAHDKECSHTVTAGDIKVKVIYTKTESPQQKLDSRPLNKDYPDKFLLADMYPKLDYYKLFKYDDKDNICDMNFDYIMKRSCQRYPVSQLQNVERVLKKDLEKQPFRHDIMKRVQRQYMYLDERQKKWDKERPKTIWERIDSFMN